MRIRALSAFFLLLAFQVLGATPAPEERFADLNGAKIHYTSYGEGTSAVVLIHGWACNASFWRLQTPALAEAYRVIAVDLPGHGQSDAPEKTDYTIEHFADGVLAALKHAGVERAVLAGHSMGVPVAARVWRRNPMMVQGLIAVDGPIWKVQRTPSTPASKTVKDMQRDYRPNASNLIESMFVNNTPLFLRAEIKRKMLLTPIHVGLNALEVMGQSDVWIKGGAIRTPVLAITATRRTRGVDDRKRLHQEVFPNLQHFELWGEAGHFLMMEQPARFNRTVLDFLLHNVPGLRAEAPTQAGGGTQH